MDHPVTSPTVPGLHLDGEKATWVEPPYKLRRYEAARKRYTLISKGMDPEGHAMHPAGKRKRQPIEDRNWESFHEENEPSLKKARETWSYQTQRHARRRTLNPHTRKRRGYTKDHLFYLKDGDVYFVVERVIFCVHKKKLTASGGYLNDVLKDNMVNHEVIKGRPVLHLDVLKIIARQFRFFLSFLYGTIIIHQLLPSGKPLLHFEAALEVLAASVKLDHQRGRQVALKGLETLFPTDGQPVPLKPIISGLRNEDEEATFYRTFPLQALPVLYEYRVPSMLPLAYYYVARLPREDVLNGVAVGSKLIKLDQNYVDIVLQAQDALRDDRQTILLKWLYDLVQGEKKLGPRKATPKCVDEDMRGNLPCFPFLKRMLDLSNTDPHDLDTRSLEGLGDKARDLIQEHLCCYCLEHVLEQADLCLAESWKHLPYCFGLPPWEELRIQQRSLEEGFAGNYT